MIIQEKNNFIYILNLIKNKIILFHNIIRVIIINLL